MPEETELDRLMREAVERAHEANRAQNAHIQAARAELRAQMMGRDWAAGQAPPNDEPPPWEDAPPPVFDPAGPVPFPTPPQPGQWVADYITPRVAPLSAQEVQQTIAPYPWVDPATGNLQIRVRREDDPPLPTPAALTPRICPFGPGCDMSFGAHHVVSRDDNRGYNICAQHWGMYGYTCLNCARASLRDWQLLSPGGRAVACTSCANKCPRCQLVYSRQTLHQCAGARPPAIGLIKGYNYKPRPEFFGKTRNELFYGIELELEANNDQTGETVAAAFQEFNKNGVVYYKHDGSLADGVEIVSHPMSFSWFHNNYPWDAFPKLAEIASNRNWRGPAYWDRYGEYPAGIHIHMSRVAFTSPLHLYRFLQFIYREVPFVESIAGRSGEGYHQAAYSKEMNGILPMPRKSGKIIYSSNAKLWEIAKRTATNDDRYIAVNCQNAATVELRVFRSTTKPGRLRGYVQFCDALFRYSDPEQGWASAGHLTAESFKKFLRKYPIRYADLHKIIAKEGEWAVA